MCTSCSLLASKRLFRETGASCCYSTCKCAPAEVRDQGFHGLCSNICNSATVTLAVKPWTIGNDFNRTGKEPELYVGFSDYEAYRWAGSAIELDVNWIHAACAGLPSGGGAVWS